MFASRCPQNIINMRKRRSYHSRNTITCWRNSFFWFFIREIIWIGTSWKFILPRGMSKQIYIDVWDCLTSDIIRILSTWENEDPIGQETQSHVDETVSNGLSSERSTKSVPLGNWYSPETYQIRSSMSWTAPLYSWRENSTNENKSGTDKTKILALQPTQLSLFEH